MTEISNNALGQFKFTRAKSPDMRTKPAEEPKLRRSKSALDLRSNKPTFKRTQPAIENIPSKRFKPGGITKPQLHANPLSKPSELKRKAIASVIKSSTNTLTSVVNKKPLIKSSSTDSAMTRKLPARTAAANKTVPPSSAPTKPATKPKIPPYDFKARFHDIKERYDTLKAKSDQQKEHITSLEEQVESFDSRERELLDKIEKIEQELFDATEDREKLIGEMKALKSTNKNLTLKNAALAANLDVTSEQFDKTKQTLAELTKKHEKQSMEYENLQKLSGTLKHDFEDASSKLLLSQDQLYQINIERKVLHNMVLDLRGVFFLSL